MLFEAGRAFNRAAPTAVKNLAGPCRTKSSAVTVVLTSLHVLLALAQLPSRHTVWSVRMRSEDLHPHVASAIAWYSMTIDATRGLNCFGLTCWLKHLCIHAQILCTIFKAIIQTGAHYQAPRLNSLPLWQHSLRPACKTHSITADAGHELSCLCVIGGFSACIWDAPIMGKDHADAVCQLCR